MDLRSRLHDRRDQLLALGLLAFAVGFLIIGLGWYGAARKDTVPEQFPYILSGGLAGLGLVLTGAALVITQSFRRDHDRLWTEFRELRDAVTRRDAVAETAFTGPQALVVAGRSSYHEPDCHLASNHTTDYLAVDEAQRRGLEPCRVCKPPLAA